MWTLTVSVLCVYATTCGLRFNKATTRERHQPFPTTVLLEAAGKGHVCHMWSLIQTNMMISGLNNAVPCHTDNVAVRKRSEVQLADC